jgi:AraC-like DNA-binding protein
MLQYREIEPPPTLRMHIRCIWRLFGSETEPSPAEPIIPDGCVEIVLNLGDRFVRHVEGGSHLQPAHLIAGQITRAVTIGSSGRVDLWGIRFHPWSAAAFLGISGNELRDRFLALDDGPLSLYRELGRLEDIDRDAQSSRGNPTSLTLPRVNSATEGSAFTDSARYAAIVAALTKRAAGLASADDVLPRLVDVAQRSRDAMSVRHLARHTGISSRRIQMLFRERVGLSPKQLLRITRFQRALGVARVHAELSWSAIAARTGYYDQAHLIHESNEIAGCTPAVLLGRDAALTEAFLSDPSS